MWGGDVACWRCGNSTHTGAKCPACDADNCILSRELRALISRICVTQSRMKDRLGVSEKE